ncbi:SDR family oxidoreductase [Miltoncostaea marina]|uniref:SDR family oxidoreductase n=1 Tax=Miltoncostaea marina TaxID=2843215 RepID=UPI001C3DE41C|nr:SDR family oxidoreductase [Miltoncostaea marina]
MSGDAERRLILLTGATGYVGGRLLPRLEARGERVSCLARDPARLRPRVGAGTEVVAGDVGDPASLSAAMAGVDVALYLVHSMAGGPGWREADRRAAEAFGAAAGAAGVRRIVYLGGLGHGGRLSEHLASRQEVGRALGAAGVPVLELRAGIIIGSGSLSYEMIRALVDRLPVMVTPRWVSTPTQPIAIDDVLDYLVGALDVPLERGRVVEIGGPDRVSYGDLMREYARQRGLRRLMIPVPVLTPRLSSLWLGLVTPVYARVGRELIGGLRNPTVVRDPGPARELFDVRPRDLRRSIGRALAAEDAGFAATRWSDARSSGPRPRRYGGSAIGSRLVDSRVAVADAPPAAAFAAIRRIGGATGWYYADALWRLRGLLDLPFGGAGIRRGRRDPERLLPGDTVDAWRVEAIEEDRLLRLAAEMRVPGRAWLQWEVEPAPGGSRIHQTAVFDPAGILGRLYWYAVWPFHGFVFCGMVRGIARAAAAHAPAGVAA